jgi:biopolymer transport protein ExbD
MPVHTPGPRLYSSIPFRVLAQKDAHGGGAVNVALNVTPFVDMMTILVTFLLMVFSASGELLQSQKNLKMPIATTKRELKRAPIIVATRDEIALDGNQMAKVDEIENDESMEWKIISLYDELRARKTKFKLDFDQLPEHEQQNCLSPVPDPEPKEMCLDGLVILQADRELSVKVLNRLLKTTYSAEYPNVMFAVSRTKTRPQ